MCRVPKPTGKEKRGAPLPNQIRHGKNFAIFGGGRMRTRRGRYVPPCPGDHDKQLDQRRPATAIGNLRILGNPVIIIDGKRVR